MGSRAVTVARDPGQFAVDVPAATVSNRWGVSFDAHTI